jgi:hypothetical protein
VRGLGETQGERHPQQQRGAQAPELRTVIEVGNHRLKQEQQATGTFDLVSRSARIQAHHRSPPAFTYRSIVPQAPPTG